MRKLLFMAPVLLCALISFGASTKGVENKIKNKAGIENAQIHNENGKIILDGVASTLWNKTEAEKIASKEFKSLVVNHIVLKSAPKSDRQLALDVRAKIPLKSADNYVFNMLSVESHNGEVILQGKLRDAYLKDDAVTAAMQTPGVRSVVDKIQLLPVSPDDDRLRLAVLNDLLKDGRLSSYFAGRFPDITIIVENGHVTLSGFVKDELDRDRAGLIANRSNGVMSIDNQLRIGQ